MSEFTQGGFRTVIGESRELKAEKVKRVIACSGKVYYDLAKKREEKASADVAILRVEQLYPFPHKAFAAELKKYPSATEIVWAQDEPQNQGAWFFVQHLHPREHARWATPGLLRARRVRFPGGRLFASAPGAAKSTGRGRLRQASGLHAHQITRATCGRRSPGCFNISRKKIRHGHRRSQSAAAVRIGGGKPPCCSGRRKPVMPSPLTRY